MEKTLNLKRVDTMNQGDSVGKQAVISFQIKILPKQSDHIIILFPGRDGGIDGYQDKYRKLSEYMQKMGLGAVVRSGNYVQQGFEFKGYTQKNLKLIIKHVLKNSKEICGKENPDLYLIGMSAGSGAIASIAHEYEQIKKILLMAPRNRSAGKDLVEVGLPKYKGELYIAVGENDTAPGEHLGNIFIDLAENAKKKVLKTIKDCNHQFKGEVNGRIFSQMPIWAFIGMQDFPNPEKGINLYD